MKAIHYAGGTIVTGDDIADAVVHYAESLARRNSSAAVDIPALLPDGRTAQVSLLLGPASQLVAIPEPQGPDDVVDSELVSQLHVRTAHLGIPRPLTNAEEPAPLIDDIDLR